MNITLKFVIDVLRSWERLNLNLVKKEAIDSIISEYINSAENICIKLSHFPELVGKKAIRTDRSSNAFSAITDVADTAKHKNPIKGRKCSLIGSSMFEGNDDGKFRFIRNRIIVDHEKYGKLDFLETTRTAIQFIIGKIGLNLFWYPEILESNEKYIDEVSLDLFLADQFSFSGITLEFLKRNSKGELIHYDPPTWPFELRSPLLKSPSLNLGYVHKLLQNSISLSSKIESKVNFSVNTAGKKNILADFVITSFNSFKKHTSIVLLIKDSSVDLKRINEFESNADQAKVDGVILISENEFSKEILQHVSLTLKKVYLITINGFDAYNIPIDFFKRSYENSHIEMTKLHKFILGVSKDLESKFVKFKGLPIKDLGKVFSLDKINLLNFREICLALFKTRKNETSGRKVINYKPKGDTSIFIKIDNSFDRIGIEADFEWKITIKDLRMPILSYVRTELGISIWNLQTYFIMKGETVKTCIPVTKYGNTEAIGMLPLHTSEKIT